MTNFADLLNRTVGTVEKPKPLPVGSYYCVIKGRELGESSQRKTPYVRFIFGVIQPGEDVDPTLLAEIPNGGAGKEIREDFYLTPEAEWRLHDFLTNVMGMQGMTTAQAVDGVVGRQVKLIIKHEMDKTDTSRIYTRVSAFQRVEG